MKNTNNNTATTLNNKEILNTTNASKELNAAENIATSNPIFSSVDLWHIQKQVRTAFARRRTLMC